MPKMIANNNTGNKQNNTGNNDPILSFDHKNGPVVLHIDRETRTTARDWS